MRSHIIKNIIAILAIIFIVMLLLIFFRPSNSEKSITMTACTLKINSNALTIYQSNDVNEQILRANISKSTTLLDSNNNVITMNQIVPGDIIKLTVNPLVQYLSIPEYPDVIKIVKTGETDFLLLNKGLEKYNYNFKLS